MGKLTPLGIRRREINSFESCALGRASRKLKRQMKKEKNLKMALDTLYAYQPELCYLEDWQSVDSEKFKRKWGAVDALLRDKFPTEKEYHSTYNEICKLLEQGKCEGFWDIAIPNSYIILRQPKLTRNYQWQQNSRFCAGIYHQGIFNQNPNQFSISEHFAFILLSMIFHGGLNRAEYWVAVGKCLEQAKPLEGDNGLLFLTLELEENTNIPTNVRRWDDELKGFRAESESIYFPDPISLGLIYQFLKRKVADWKAPKSLSSCLSLINKTFNLNLKSRTLGYGGAAFAEQIEGISLPQVMLEIAIGKQHSASLPRAYLTRFFQPDICSIIDTSFHYFAYKKAIPQQAKKNTAISAEKPFFYEALKDIFSWNNNEKQSPTALISALMEIQKEELSLPQTLFVNWFLHLLQDRKNEPSTLKRYFHTLALRWLVASERIDFIEMDAEDFLLFYQDILDEIASSKERYYCAGRLDDLHQYAVVTFGFVPLSESLSSGNENQAHVCAGFIDEHLFKGLLAQFDHFSDLSSFELKMYKLFLIIAFRSGLRPGEIAKLRIKDVESSKDTLLFVRSNKFGSNKTSFAKRNIRLMPLLTEAEQNLFKAYRHERSFYNSNSTALFFCLPENSHQKIDLSTLSRATSQILTYLSGGNYYRFYHLRHSALSRIQLLLHSQELAYPPAIRAQVPYDNEQCREILDLICGKNRVRDRYHALAAFAGHSDPSVTLENYLHFSDLIIGLIMQNNQTQLSKTQASVFFGLSAYQIREYLKCNSDLIVKDIAKQIKNKLTAFIQKSTSKTKETTELTLTDLKVTAQSKIADDYDIAIPLLRKIQQGEDYADFAWFYNLTEAQIAKWLDTANALKSLKTNRDKSKLFPSTRFSQLLPAFLKDSYESKDIQRALKNYRLHFALEEQNEDLRWVIQYGLTHCNSSRSGIYFNDVFDYHRFMDIACIFYPSTRWRFLLKFTEDGVIKAWQYKSVNLTSYRKKQAGRFAGGAGWLLLKHKNEDERVKTGLSRYSSQSFRVFLHRLAIILFTKDDIKQWV